MSEEKKKVPIGKGLFTIPESPDEEPHLIGGKCPNCGELLFPSQPICPNCCKEGVEPTTLSRRGKIWSSTIVGLGAIPYAGPVPYCVALVELPEGVVVPTPFINPDPAIPPELGSEAEMVLEKFGEDGQGNEIMMYKFKPV